MVCAIAFVFFDRRTVDKNSDQQDNDKRSAIEFPLAFASNRRLTLLA
jgi:hypothetical protein